jgi:uncharacterized protein YndB with AHSA1/START domain
MGEISLIAGENNKNCRHSRDLLQADGKENQMKNELVITRIFDAPRDLVFKAWTDRDMFMQWWGPKGFTTPHCTIDLRVGGRYLNCMRSPEGKDYWSTGVYREIIPMERLVLSDSFSDENGNVISAADYGMTGDWPLEMQITVTFEDHADKTKLTLTHSGIAGISDMDYDNMHQGWSESFDKLADLLEKSARVLPKAA